MDITSIENDVSEKPVTGIIDMDVLVKEVLDEIELSRQLVKARQEELHEAEMRLVGATAQMRLLERILRPAA